MHCAVDWSALSPHSAETALANPGPPPCPVCRGTDFGPAQAGSRLRPCRGCGVLLNDRAVTRVEEERLYDHCASVPGSDQSAAAAAQLEFALRRMGKPATEISVLDIGCGRGAFLIAARSAGARVMGLELDPASVAVCREANVPVVQGSVFDVGVPTGPWSLITFWDVLDHLEDPAAAVRLALEALSPGGVLVARGRNARIHLALRRLYRGLRPIAVRLGVRDPSVVHRWGFDRRHWRRLLEDAGLSGVELASGVPTPGDRYGALGSRRLAGGIKTAGGGVARFIATLSGGRCDIFPSVLVSGSRHVALSPDQ